MTTPQIQTIIEHSQAVTDAPDRYSVAVGQALRYLIGRSGQIRRDIEEAAGLRPGVVTLLVGGHYGGLADDDAWVKVLNDLGVPTHAYADGFEFRRLLGDLALWRLFSLAEPESPKIEHLVQEYGHTWASLDRAILYDWPKGEIESGRIILRALLDVDIDHEANSDGFISLLSRWQDITGYHEADED